jgi:hypothetical protein
MKMKKSKYLNIGVIITLLTALVGSLYWKLTGQLITTKKISNILFIEFLVIFPLGAFMYFKDKFWVRPWEKEENEEDSTEGKETNEKTEASSSKQQTGLKLILISLPLLVISILITLI